MATYSFFYFAPLFLFFLLFLLSINFSHHSNIPFNFNFKFCTIYDSIWVQYQVLTVNTDCGGHDVIGFYFAKELMGAGHAVTILTVGEESSDKMKKPPFTRFSEFVNDGGRTIWGNPADIGTVVGDEVFDVVLDNNGRDLDAVSKLSSRSENSVHMDQDVVKAAAGHVGVEKYIVETFESWAVFRPQYMIESGNNIDCDEWFFHKIVRDRPVPIPGSGMQFIDIPHVRDLSSMLALAVEKPDAASRKIFKYVSDRAATLEGMAKLCAQAAGRPVNIVHYDPKAVGIDAKKSFPFPNMHFYAESRAATEILGWQATTDLPEDLKERFDEYVKIERQEAHKI